MARRRRGPSQLGLALAVPALIAAMGLVVIYFARKQGAAEDAVEAREDARKADRLAQGREVTEALDEAKRDEDANPFARLGEHPMRRDRNEQTDPDAPQKPEPEPGELTASELWQEALEDVETAFGRLQLRTEARERGDDAAADRYEGEALELFEGALDRTRVWAENDVEQFDPDNVQVREIKRSRKRWERHVEKLR